ncbi:MAG TPA: hypothetical protein VK919_06840 [Solirubrobacterales bacterium]|nr:hypothetical protein [Solirubrobacterales bacterium]
MPGSPAPEVPVDAAARLPVAALIRPGLTARREPLLHQLDLALL